MLKSEHMTPFTMKALGKSSSQKVWSKRKPSQSWWRRKWWMILVMRDEAKKGSRVDQERVETDREDS